MVEVHRSAGVTQTVTGDGRGNPWREGAAVAWKSWRRRSWKRDPGLGAGAGARTWLVKVRTWLSPMAAPCPAVITGEELLRLRTPCIKFKRLDKTTRNIMNVCKLTECVTCRNFVVSCYIQ
jgi:hypothetical protein